MLTQLRSRPALVVAVLSYEHRLSGAVEQFKAVVQLVDGSNLHLNEVWIGGQLRKYAYYQVMPTGQVIRGWDNAPHHPEVPTYPRHLHAGSGVYPSLLRSLSDVLGLLEAELLSGTS